MMATALFVGEEAVRHTPEQLDVLAEAGVVDAGALGLVVIIRGMVAGLAGEAVSLPEIPHYAAARIDDVHHVDSRFRFCTNFIVIGERLDHDAFIGDLERLGDSVLVVGDEATLKVHVHTDDPDSAKALFAAAGRVEREDIADMHEQVAGQRARLGDGIAAVVAVASGDGLRSLYEELGALVVDGGPTLNPPTKDLLEGIDACPAAEVVLLPNSADVLMAAEEAARLAAEAGHRGQLRGPAGGACGAGRVRSPPGRGGERGAAASRARRRPCRGRGAGGPRRFGGPVSSRRCGRVRRRRAGRLGRRRLDPARDGRRLAEGAEIVTVIEGAEASIPLGELELGLSDGIEIELHRGGTPNYSWLIAAQ